MKQRAGGKKFAPSRNGKNGKVAKPPKSASKQIRDVERLLKRVSRDAWPACLLAAALCSYRATSAAWEATRVDLSSVQRASSLLCFPPLRHLPPGGWLHRCRRQSTCLPAWLLCAQPDLDPKMRERQEAKLQELRAAQAEQQRKELERKYAVRYHKARPRLPPCALLLQAPTLLQACSRQEQLAAYLKAWPLSLPGPTCPSADPLL